MSTLEEIIARWDSGEGKPYKGSLIDWKAYEGDGEEPPTDIGCMCAQGQVLHLLGGWTPRRLNETRQIEADREAAKLLNISVAHAIVLRKVNDSVDGAPSIVLTNPEKILGNQAHVLLAFWKHIDRMTDADWKKVAAVARAAAWDAAWDAAGAAARDVVGAAARDAAWDAARDAAWDAAWAAARDAAGAAARDAAGAAAGAAARDVVGASNEIQGAALMRQRGQSFFFLPLFGFASPEAVATS